MSTKNKTVRVRLSYAPVAIGNAPYRIESIANEIVVPILKKSRHVGEYLTELEAQELATEPNLDVTTTARNS